MASTTPIRTSSFLDSIGVNTHMAWRGTTSAYKDQAAVKNAIEYLGVTHIRDGSPTEGWTMPMYFELAAKGIKFDILTTPEAFASSGSFSTDLSRIETLLKAFPGSVDVIEGLNEINRFPVSYNGGSTGSNIALGREIQSILYNEVNSNSLLKDIPVLNLSVGGLTSTQSASLGNLSNVADYGNWHVYFGIGEQPAKNIQTGITSAKSIAPSDPVMITESNNYTAVNAMEWGGGGVTEAVQAKLNLNLIMDSKYYGAERLYLYELLDNSLVPGATNTVEGSLGLFHTDGSPKQAAKAIHNLTTILADGAGNADTFATKALDFTVSGLPANGKTMLMQEANGNYNIAVWAEPDIWNENTRTAISVPQTPVTIDLAQTASTIKVYDPILGTYSIANYTNTDKVTIYVSDHPLIVEVSGLATNNSSAGAVTAGYTQTIGSGSESLTVKLSQDRWNGDAEYKVFVDGQQVGGTLSARSIHNSGQADTLVIKGEWAAGDHQVKIQFTNDAYGGTAGTDRNLYVESVSYDGKAISGAKADLKSPTSATFTFTDTDGGGSHDFVLNANTTLTGQAGAQRWGDVAVSATNWSGTTVNATKSVDGLGVTGGRFGNQIDFNPATGKSETITLDFGHDVDYATLRFTRMAQAENGSPERAAWKAYAEDGSVVGQGTLTPTNSNKVSSLTHDFRIDTSVDFAKLEISAAPYTAYHATDSSDVALASVSYHTTDAVF